MFMVVDDLGWNDIGWHNPQIVSPTLSTLAGEGVTLLDHSTFKWCSPTRSSILTGRYPYHLGQQTNINMNPATTLPCGVHPDYAFIPKVLRDHGGYATHALGKWHLGYFKAEYTPTHRGFDQGCYLRGARGAARPPWPHDCIGFLPTSC
jgi:arylsulfatase B/arylsulfatase I/J